MADVMLANIVATVVAMAAMFLGNGTLCACLTPSAMATPEAMAICANANTFDNAVSVLFFSPKASIMPPSALTA